MVSDKALKIVITANGEGTRMRGLSPKPKHLLYYGGKRIIDHIRDCFRVGIVYVFGSDGRHVPDRFWLRCRKTRSRKAQLEYIREWRNVLIVDCDVIPHEWPDFVPTIPNCEEDRIWFFESDCQKYGGLEMAEDGTLRAAKERGEKHKFRASGLYFLKHVGTVIDRMTDPNSIASGMAGARMIQENTFIRVGDAEDYLSALK